jgi:GNAT superfamily N-acetyltransferase
MSTIKITESPVIVRAFPRWGKSIQGIASATKARLTVNGNVVSSANLVQLYGILGGKRLRLGGIGGVYTEPAFRHQGHALELMRGAVEYMTREYDVEGCVLFCLPPLLPMYERDTWGVVHGAVMFRQPGSKKEFPIPDGIFTLTTFGRTESDLDLESLPW